MAKKEQYGNEHTSKSAFDTYDNSNDMIPKGDQKDPTIGRGKNGLTKGCGTCNCEPCECKKKESVVTSKHIIDRMVEKGYNKNQIKAVLKEMESEAVERAEEKLGKDLDGDGEKGESKAHKAKVLNKESTNYQVNKIIGSRSSSVTSGKRAGGSGVGERQRHLKQDDRDLLDSHYAYGDVPQPPKEELPKGNPNRRLIKK